MAVFGKKGPGNGPGEESADFVRIPAGTRIAAAADGKLLMAFAGDMSFGEGLPELSEINCGRNLSIDAGVTIRADSVRVKATLELEAGARLITRELEVERLVSRKGQVEARTITAGAIELDGSKVVADRITARENVLIDRGEMEIGTIVAQTLTVTKGTIANILITEVAKLDGAITKGGYENFAEFLAKVLLYHPEVLNDRFGAEARRAAPVAGEARSADGGEEIEPDPALLQRLAHEAQRLRAFYQDKDLPREMADLLGHIEGQRVGDVRRSLTPIYQRLAPQGKMPEAVMDVFREIQKLLREAPRARAAAARPA